MNKQIEAGVASEDGHEVLTRPRNSVFIEKSSVARQKMDEGIKIGRIHELLELQTTQEFGRMFIDEGKSRYVSHTIWTILNKQVDDIQGILAGIFYQGSDNASPESNPVPAMENQDHRSFILGYSPSRVNLRPLHSFPFEIPSYCKCTPRMSIQLSRFCTSRRWRTRLEKLGIAWIRYQAVQRP